MIYVLKAWAHKDGETNVFCFSSEEKRKAFMEELEHDAQGRLDSQYWWNYNWETEELVVDPKAPTGY